MKHSDVKVDGKRINGKSYPWAFRTTLALGSASEQYKANVAAILPDLDTKSPTHKELIPAIRDKVRADFLNLGLWPLNDQGKPVGKESELRKYGAGKAWLAHATWLRTYYPAEGSASQDKSPLDKFRTAYNSFAKNATPKEWKAAQDEGLIPAGPKPKQTKIRKK